MNKTYFQRLFAYNCWANSVTQDCVKVLKSEQLDENLGASFPTIRTTLEHIVMAEWVWFERIKGDSPTQAFNGEKFASLENLFEKWSEVENSYANFVDEISDNQLLDIIDYKNLAGEANSRCLGHILPHVVNHGTYHRGQIAAFLRQIGAEAKTTDLIYFEL